jgi:hypothetical protein
VSAGFRIGDGADDDDDDDDDKWIECRRERGGVGVAATTGAAAVGSSRGSLVVSGGAAPTGVGPSMAATAGAGTAASPSASWGAGSGNALTTLCWPGRSRSSSESSPPDEKLGVDAASIMAASEAPGASAAAGLAAAAAAGSGAVGADVAAAGAAGITETPAAEAGCDVRALSGEESSSLEDMAKAKRRRAGPGDGEESDIEPLRRPSSTASRMLNAFVAYGTNVRVRDEPKTR